MKSRLLKLEGHRSRLRQTIHDFTDAELEAVVAAGGIGPSDEAALVNTIRNGEAKL